MTGKVQGYFTFDGPGHECPKDSSHVELRNISEYTWEGLIVEMGFVKGKTEIKPMCLLKGKERVGERPPLLGLSVP